MLHQIPTPKRSWCPPGWPQPRAKPPSQTSIPSTSSGGSSQEGSGWWQLQPKPQIPAKHGEKKTKKKRKKEEISEQQQGEAARTAELEFWGAQVGNARRGSLGGSCCSAATEHRKIPLFVSEKSTFLPYHRNNSLVLGGFCKSQGLAEIWGGFNPDLGAHGCISSPGENPIFPQSCSHGVAPPSPL